MCFDNYIGVRADCLGDAEEPESELYINDLPGISIETAGDIADSEYVNGVALLRDRIAFAAKKVRAEIGMKMSGFLRMAPALTVDHAGEWKITGVDANDYTTGGADPVGVEICMDQRPHFRMGRIRVTEVEVLMNTGAAGQTLTFTDHLGNVASTATFTTVAGVVTVIPVNAEFNTSRLFINYPPAARDYNNSRLRVAGCKGCGGLTQSFRDYGYVRVRGREGADASAEYSMNTFGLNVRFEIICSQEELMCRLKGMDTFKFLMLFASGIEFAKEAISSSRFNAVTNLRKDDFIDLLAKWQEDYNSLFSSFADNISRTLTAFGDECIICKETKTISARI